MMADPLNPSHRTKAFTLVFRGDIRNFKMNPLTTETSWGIPYAVSMGDALEELDALKEVCSRIAEKMERRDV